MKTISLKKFVIPGLTLLIGGALAASISSTVAWFQYATSARVAYVGALSHCSKLLKISVDNGDHWGNDFYQNDMAGHIQGNHLLPITTGPQAKDEGLVYHSVDDGNGGTKNIVRFYSQPEYGFGGNYSRWHFASEQNYAQFTILVKVNDVDGNNTPTPLVNDVFLSKIIIEDDSANGTGSDLSDAVRVHLAVSDATNQTKYLLFSKSVDYTVVSGKLDLNNDKDYDKDLVLWDGSECVYGTPGSVQYSYKVNDTDAVVEDPDNPVSANPISLGKTGSGFMRIVVTTWVEGWSKLDHGYSDNKDGETNTSVWDPAHYVNKKFNVGIRLGVKSHDSDHQN